MRRPKSSQQSKCGLQPAQSAIAGDPERGRGIKGGDHLLGRVPAGQNQARQAVKSIEDSASAGSDVLDYDLLTLADAQGKPIAGFVGKNIEDAPLDSISTISIYFHHQSWGDAV